VQQQRILPAALDGGLDCHVPRHQVQLQPGTAENLERVAEIHGYSQLVIWEVITL
jgi:hypothetical protein